MSLKFCSNLVFKSFRRFEKLVDRITGKVGPVFVFLAIVLILGCIVTFFEVVYTYQFWNDESSWLKSIAGFAWCSWLVVMFCFHYISAITIRPGFPSDQDRPLQSSVPSRSWTDFMPQAICIGPLAALSASSRDNDGKSKLSKVRSKALREIVKVNEARKAAQSMRERSREKEKDKVDEHGIEVDHDISNRIDRLNARVCKKCPVGVDGPPEKPERSHHCSICKKCVLKYGHHCPWISQCVGLANERYFVLFLSYFTVACATVGISGWSPMLMTLDFTNDWPYRTPRPFTLILWALTSVMFFAVGTMAVFQILLILKGESEVEGHDNDWYKKQAKARGNHFSNPYDLGRRRNVELFFNIGEMGDYHWSTLLLPMRIPPTSDGRKWLKQDGWESGRVNVDEELTDEEEMSDGEQ